MTEYGVPTTAVGRAVVVMVSAAAEMVSVRLAVAVWAGELESVTLKLSGVAVTTVAGVPLISPLEVFKVKPAGNVPEINCQAYAPVPPVAVSVCEYAVPMVPPGSDVVVMERGVAVMVRVRLTLAVSAGEPESVALKVRGVAFTRLVGVPPIKPVEAFSVNPLGKVPEVNCQVCAPVPPTAVSVCE